jgi:methionyl-tRNA synthetase
MIYLKPILPITAEKTEKFLNIPAMAWNHRQNSLLGHTINPFMPLLQRIPEETIENMQKIDFSATN